MKPDQISFRKFPADTLIMSGIPILIIAMSTSAIMEHTSALILVALGVALLGATLLFISKLPLYRKGEFFSIGSAGIPAAYRRFYRWGLILSIAGCAIAAMLIPVLYFLHR